ncbi:MAG: Omp28-related outer membrane protein [candidate division WOR-3 bacterium]|nr:Omp28-related outer membrane protein [candidate division WOR-3 bacterium]
MKKIVLLSCIIIGTLAFAAQRVVVCENFTATWCQYCPGAARALDENYTRSYDSVVVISYHPSTSDPFYSTEAAARLSYYSVSGYPTTIFDGVRRVVGGLRFGTMYAIYRDTIAYRLNISSPLDISLTCNYDTISNTGTVNATILNITSSPISGTLHFVIVENNIPYSWQGMSKLEFLMRDMVPDANGEAVTIPANSSISRSRNFTIASNWKEKDCKIIVFVQAANREIYQGAEIGIVPIPGMDYYGLNITETAGNHNRWAEPGEAIRIYVYGKNLRDGIYTGSTTVTCSDPYITISGATPQTVEIRPGDVDTVNICDFTISDACPTPRLVSFFLNFGSKIDTIPFMITRSPGFSDNMESGQDNWTHSGTNDNWHITTYKSYSPTRSWYCGVEGSWQYTNQNDASLISVFFVATPDSSLKLWHQYSLEAGWDYGYVEIDNGSGWWQTLGKFTGTQSAWTQLSYPLTSYSGQTVRIRFRFISDASIVQEGWYIDDVNMPRPVGIETKENNKRLTLSITPNPFTEKVAIICQSSNFHNMSVSVKIYDASGRLVKSLTANPVIIWNGDDSNGKMLPSGIYFVKLESESETILEKVVIVR